MNGGRHGGTDDTDDDDDVEAVPAAVWLVFGLAWLLAGAYVGLPLFDARGRTPYDRLAGSVVIVDGPVGADSSRRTNASP